MTKRFRNIPEDRVKVEFESTFDFSKKEATSKSKLIHAKGTSFAISITGIYETALREEVGRQVFDPVTSLTSTPSSSKGTWKQFGYTATLMDGGHYEVLVRREDGNVTDIAIVLGEHEAFEEHDDEEDVSLEDVEVPRKNHQNTALPDDVFLTNILQAMRIFYVNDQKSLNTVFQSKVRRWSISCICMIIHLQSNTFKCQWRVLVRKPASRHSRPIISRFRSGIKVF